MVKLHVPDQHGVTHERALSIGGQGLAFYAFDLLWLNGKDLRQHALLERKAISPSFFAVRRLGSSTPSISVATAGRCSIRRGDFWPGYSSDGPGSRSPSASALGYSAIS